MSSNTSFLSTFQNNNISDNRGGRIQYRGMTPSSSSSGYGNNSFVDTNHNEKYGYGSRPQQPPPPPTLPRTTNIQKRSGFANGNFSSTLPPQPQLQTSKTWNRNNENDNATADNETTSINENADADSNKQQSFSPFSKIIERLSSMLSSLQAQVRSLQEGWSPKNQSLSSKTVGYDSASATAATCAILSCMFQGGIFLCLFALVLIFFTSRKSKR
jgi:hypothetical protein